MKSTAHTGGYRVCDRCKTAPTTAFWCVSCAHNYLDETYAPGDPNRQLEANKSGLSEYPDVCADHGKTLFSARVGKCQKCLNPRAVARRAGENTYIDRCLTHGQTEHHVNTGKCLTCFSSNGVARRGHADGARAAARREGEAAYRTNCSVHGQTEHHVNTGKCLTCFNAMGVRRPAAPPITVTQAIAVLRAAGLGIDEIALLLD